MKFNRASFSDGDQVTLNHWYASAANRGVTKLQVLTSEADYDSSSTNPMTKHGVTVFDFTKLVSAFDTARSAGLTNGTGWGLASSLSAARVYVPDSAVNAIDYVNPWAALQAGTALMDSAPTTAIQPFVNGPQNIDHLLFAALNSGGTPGAAGWARS